MDPTKEDGSRSGKAGALCLAVRNEYSLRQYGHLVAHWTSWVARRIGFLVRHFSTFLDSASSGLGGQVGKRERGQEDESTKIEQGVYCRREETAGCRKQEAEAEASL